MTAPVEDRIECRDCHRPLFDPLSRRLRRGPQCRGERGRGGRGRARDNPGHPPADVCAGQGEIPGLEGEGEGT